MIGELMGATGALGTLAVALLIFGFAPGLLLALIVRLLHPDDPRRQELHAELYAVPRWERPFWVCEQFEVALREGLFPHATWWVGRVVWHRAKLRSGLEQHRQYPDSFEVPTDETKELLRPGDSVKLMWAVRRQPGERMWVRIIHRDGDRLIGTLENDPVFVFKDYGDTVKFHIDDIIDCSYDDDEGEQVA